MSISLILLVIALLLTIVSLVRPSWPVLSVAVLLVIIALFVGVQPIR